ncbi:hypothetical protein BE08_02505 [Sorangium cellulosum]|uniref:Uncharacterized protein n=1 Tax=Sorangium cellulosum TaxID=56 RepID=A0A150PKS2_SORCE|nr:hypothetical protein BE08_02505 [Sorangium cellulosum]
MSDRARSVISASIRSSDGAELTASEASASPLSCSLRRRSSRRARIRSVASTPTTTPATICPEASRMGAALYSMMAREPSARSISTGSDRTSSPVVTARASGHSCGAYGLPSAWKPA